MSSTARDDTAPAGRTFVVGDSLRAIAALSVLVFHQIPEQLMYGNPAMVAAFGRLPGAVLASLDLGLYLFFVLSGYLLARPFLRAYILGNPMPGVGRYFRNRALRLVPAYWLIFTLVFLRYALFPSAYPAGSFASPPYEVVAVYGFFQNFFPHSTVAFEIGPAWTLDVEVAFYCLIPLAALAIFRLARPSTVNRRIALVLALIAVVAAGSSLFRAVAPAEQVWRRSIPAMLICFLPGVTLAALEPALARRLPGWRWARATSFGLLGLALGCFLAYHRVAGWIPASDHSAPALRILLAAAGCGSIVAAPLVWQWAGLPAWRLLDNRVLRWLGERSYGIYLWHWVVGLEVARVGLSLAPTTRSALRLAIVLPATLVASALTYRFVERPFLEMKTRRVVAPARDRRLRRGMAMGLSAGVAFAAVVAVTAAPSRAPQVARQLSADDPAAASVALASSAPGSRTAATRSPAPASSAGRGPNASRGTSGTATRVPAAACSAAEMALALTPPATAIVPGTTATIAVAIRNTAATACNLPPAPPALTITDAAGRVVFQKCVEVATCDPVAAPTLQPGDTFAQAVQWDGTSSTCIAGSCQSAPVPPGSYSVTVAWLASASVPVSVGSAPPTPHAAVPGR